MRRFFSADSFWNTPIAAEAESDPRSERCVELLRREPTGGLHINIVHYTVPVYEVDADTPMRTVHQRVASDQEGRPRTWGPAGRTFWHGPGFGPEVPIPDHAVSDPASDKHMALVDPKRGLCWDMWAARRRADDEWESYTGMHYSLDGDGVWRVSDFSVQDGESIHFHGPGRAAGVPVIAGLIMREEVLAGRIAHKLAFATRYSAYKEFVSPAAWTDGNLVGGVPEGAVLQLDPGLDLDAFDLSPGGRTVARALQQYGMVNVDCARAGTLYAEGLYWPGAPSWDGVLAEKDVAGIPLEHLRMLKLGDITPMGDGRGRVADPSELEKR